MSCQARTVNRALGAYLPGFQEDPDRTLREYRSLAGRFPALINGYQRWDRGSAFTPRALDAAAGVGAAYMLTWEPWPGQLDPIASGESDAYVQEFARDASVHGAPLLVRFAHEMNLRGIPWAGSPNVFRAAWRRVRTIFNEAGATNVQFVWSPYVQDGSGDPFAPYFPGADMVDWLALDGYNWGARGWREGWRNRWQGFNAIFERSYREIVALAPDRPVLIAEMGCAERGGNKAAWIRDALLRAVPGDYSQLVGIAWFNQFPTGHADWRINSSAQALAAWRTVVADPLWSLGGMELTGTKLDR
ncbi:MAG TPA: hypothetical protein VIA82_06240 [Candidatus Limnocylindria bacterium]